MRALRTHRVLSRRVFRCYYHCLRPLAYAKGGSGRLTVMAGFNDGWLEDTTPVGEYLRALLDKGVEEAVALVVEPRLVEQAQDARVVAIPLHRVLGDVERDVDVHVGGSVVERHLDVAFNLLGVQ